MITVSTRHLPILIKLAGLIGLPDLCKTPNLQLPVLIVWDSASVQSWKKPTFVTTPSQVQIIATFGLRNRPKCARRHSIACCLGFLLHAQTHFSSCPTRWLWCGNWYFIVTPPKKLLFDFFWSHILLRILFSTRITKLSWDGDRIRRYSLFSTGNKRAPILTCKKITFLCNATENTARKLAFLELQRNIKFFFSLFYIY